MEEAEYACPAEQAGDTQDQAAAADDVDEPGDEQCAGGPDQYGS